VTARREWTWGVAKSFEEMEQLDEAWWLALDPAARLALVYDLSASFDWKNDEQEEDVVSHRILGADWGVRAQEG
jgi:hypothetical protein